MKNVIKIISLSFLLTISLSCTNDKVMYLENSPLIENPCIYTINENNIKKTDIINIVCGQYEPNNNLLLR